MNYPHIVFLKDTPERVLLLGVHLLPCKWIFSCNWVAITIWEQILVPNRTIRGCCNQTLRVCIDKPLGFGTIVSALEILRSCLGWILLCVPEGEFPSGTVPFWGGYLLKQSVIHRSASPLWFHDDCQDISGDLCWSKNFYESKVIPFWQSDPYIQIYWYQRLI